MSRKVYTAEMDEWMLANYGRGDCVGTILADFARRFGWEPSMRGFMVHASYLGVRIRKPAQHEPAPKTAVRAVHFCKEPEMQRWMLANAGGKSIDEISAAFAAEFGFPLSRPQIVNWRQRNGFASRHGSSRSKIPVGTWREGAKGFLVVKVAERPTHPGTKDNWRPLSRVKWEQYHGRPLPEGCIALFTNRNTRDFRECNLVAVPKRLVGRVNAPDSPEWHDAESLKACMAWCELGHAITSAKMSLPRRCKVCGAEFVPQEDWQVDAITCPACVASGHRARGTRRAKSGPATATCAVCGAEFTKEQCNQRRCRKCIERWPKYEAEKARSIYEKEKRNGRVG